MSKIHHVFHIDAPQDRVFEAISTITGLKKWWVNKVSGKENENDEICFSFGENMDIKFLITKNNGKDQYSWKCLEGHPEWVNTNLNFSLSQNENKTRVDFVHDNWQKATDFMANCNFSWGRYLVSLRNYCENNNGTPFMVK